jgi:hypothetical protein
VGAGPAAVKIVTVDTTVTVSPAPEAADPAPLLMVGTGPEDESVTEEGGLPEGAAEEAPDSFGESESDGLGVASEVGGKEGMPVIGNLNVEEVADGAGTWVIAKVKIEDSCLRPKALARMALEVTRGLLLRVAEAVSPSSASSHSSSSGEEPVDSVASSSPSPSQEQSSSPSAHASLSSSVVPSSEVGASLAVEDGALELAVAGAALELAGESVDPVLLPDPVRPPVAPLASILAVASASVSQAVEIPGALTSGRA